jgi:hypothetical protein
MRKTSSPAQPMHEHVGSRWADGDFDADRDYGPGGLGASARSHRDGGGGCARALAAYAAARL